MAIRNIIINTADVPRSLDFYRRFLGAEVIGAPTSERALLDVVTATIELRGLAEPSPSPWALDDLTTGFRHVGFKVADVDRIVAALKAAQVPFHLDPLEAEGGVRIAFFHAPEGTLLELVARDLQYTVVFDEGGVARERDLGTPSRPRFDHVAVTVRDLGATEEFYRPFGFTRIGRIEQPHDARGFHIDFLKGDDTVLEIFTYDVPTSPPKLDPTAPGFLAAVIEGPPEGVPGEVAEVAEAGGDGILVDADGFPFAVQSAGTAAGAER